MLTTTIVGVMRFLQMEWHNHERARNTWDIERAEMKAKIAKQEGECRHAKRINEQLERQVRMLEMALKSERAKAKKKEGNGEAAPDGESKGHKRGLENGGSEDCKGSEKVAGAEKGQRHRRMSSHRRFEVQEKTLTDILAGSRHPHNSFLETEDPAAESEKAREKHLDEATKYLKGCMREIQYLLTPPQHPPPPQLLPNGGYTGLLEPPLSVEDIYARHPQVRMSNRGQVSAGQMLPQQVSQQNNSNHQPQTVPNNLPQQSAQDRFSGRFADYPQDVSEAPPANPSLQTTQPQSISGMHYQEDKVESITHTFDSLGRPVEESSEGLQQIRPGRQAATETDGWTFDEEQNVQNEKAPDPSRRPDTDIFPSAAAAASTLPAAKSPPRGGSLGVGAGHRRKSSHGSQVMARRRSSQGKQDTSSTSISGATADPDANEFRVKFALRGHLDVVRSIVFSGGGSPSEPEVCTSGDDGTIKRWIIPATYQSFGSGQAQHDPKQHDLDIAAYFTHRGHDGIVTSLVACPASTGFSTGGRANGDGWIFSGGQDATVRVWERGRVDPKATLEGHTDAVWAVCVLPASVGAVFGPQQASAFGGADRLILVSGSADGSVKVWAVSAPPQGSSPSTGSRRGVGGSRRHSVTSGSNFPSSPQPSVASNTPFNHTLIHTITRPVNDAEKPRASPTSIAPLSPNGETFVVAYTDSSVLIFDTRTGEEVIGMASNETYDGTPATQINTVVATSVGLEAGSASLDASRGLEAEEVGAGATGSREGVEGVVITGHEDRFVRFFDANSGKSRDSLLTFDQTSLLWRG